MEPVVGRGLRGAHGRRNPSGSIVANQGDMLLALALAGAGIVRLAEFHISADLRAGRLVALFPEHQDRVEEPDLRCRPEQTQFEPTHPCLSQLPRTRLRAFAVADGSGHDRDRSNGKVATLTGRKVRQGSELSKSSSGTKPYGDQEGDPNVDGT